MNSLVLVKALDRQDGELDGPRAPDQHGRRSWKFKAELLEEPILTHDLFSEVFLMFPSREEGEMMMF